MRTNLIIQQQYFIHCETLSFPPHFWRTFKIELLLGCLPFWPRNVKPLRSCLVKVWMLEKGMSKLWTDSDCARTNEKTLVLSVSTTVRSDKDESFYFHHTLTPLKGENWIEEYACKDFLFSSITLKAISFGSTPIEIEAIPLSWTTSTHPIFVWSLFLGHKQGHKSYLRSAHQFNVRFLLW